MNKKHKLLFFTKMDFGVAANGGIKKKVFAQARAFRAHGFEVDVLSFSQQIVQIEGQNTSLTFPHSGSWSRLRFLFGGFLSVIDIKEYDYLYVRHFLTNPLFLWLLYRVKKAHPSIKIFMEIPTFPYRFEFGKMPFTKRLELWVDERCTDYFKYYIERIVTFSSKTHIFNIPTIRTDNGIDIEQFTLLNKAPYDGQTLHLLGLANVQIWHGIDRFLEGMKVYYSKKTTQTVQLHVVGSGDEIPRLQTLTAKYGLQDAVFFHGFLSGTELDAMFRRCHLGVGSCGMHRINVAKGETSALKSREYAARGLPFVIGYEDRGFPENYPYLLQIDADETPVDMQRLVYFYEDLQQNYPHYNLEMNQYAKDNLTWQAKLKNVVDAFLE
jgi:glycosyltransferase involved in cell wall biosynthesis